MQVRNLALAARGCVLKMIPDTTEQVDVKARIIGYGYGPKYADSVCMIMPTKAGVNLGIAFAMELPDPEKRLEGTGKVHRHVKLKSKSDLESAALKSLLKAAITAATARRAKTGQNSTASFSFLCLWAMRRSIQSPDLCFLPALNLDVGARPTGNALRGSWLD
jgi:hypothetical protein